MARCKDNPRQILLDLDGTTVDFVRGVIRWYKSDAQYQDIRWDLENIVCPGMPPKQFWANLNEYFWSNLEWIPEGKELYHLLLAEFGKENMCVCSSPSSVNAGASAAGKLAWIANNMPELRRHYMLVPNKQFASGPNRILIDDSEHNQEVTDIAGGRFVIVPQPWNHRKHKMTGDSYNPQEVFEEVKRQWYSDPKQSKHS